MPRIVVACACLPLVVGACFFDADYGTGRVRCSDGKCPSGLSCVSGTCVSSMPDDAMPLDGDAMLIPDGPTAALTCVDAGPFASTGGSASGSTTGRQSLVSASCDGFVMNGPDAVYKLTAGVGDQLLVSISGSYAVNAYVLAPCSQAPATPTCLTNMAAAAGNPISVTTTFAGMHFIVVDGPNPAESGSYSLTVTVN